MDFKQTWGREFQVTAFIWAQFLEHANHKEQFISVHPVMILGDRSCLGLLLSPWDRVLLYQTAPFCLSLPSARLQACATLSAWDTFLQSLLWGKHPHFLYSKPSKMKGKSHAWMQQWGRLEWRVSQPRLQSCFQDAGTHLLGHKTVDKLFSVWDGVSLSS